MMHLTRPVDKISTSFNDVGTFSFSFSFV
jgi:hypothetical protein